MISKTLQIVMLLAVIVYFVVLFQMLKKKRLNLKYTLLWIFSGFLMLCFVVFPQMLSWLAVLIGVSEPTNGLFAVVCFCIIMILMSLTAIVSKLNEQVKTMAQSLAELEKIVREQNK